MGKRKEGKQTKKQQRASQARQNRCIFCNGIIRGTTNRVDIELHIRLNERSGSISGMLGAEVDGECTTEESRMVRLASHLTCADTEIMTSHSAVVLSEGYFMTDEYNEQWNTLIHRVYTEYLNSPIPQIYDDVEHRIIKELVRSTGIKEVGLILTFPISRHELTLYNKVGAESLNELTESGE